MSDLIIIGGFFGFWLLAVIGWVANVVKFAGALADPITGLEVLRALGIFAVPIGCILGFL